MCLVCLYKEISQFNEIVINIDFEIRQLYTNSTFVFNILQRT